MLDALADLPGFGQGNERENLAAALLMRSETGLIALDPHQRIVLANHAACGLLGLEEEIGGQMLAATLPRARLLRKKAVTEALRWLEDGAAVPLFLPLDAETKLSIVPAAGPGGHTLLSIARARRAAAPSDRRDPLTGLSDRLWFIERLTALLAEAQSSPALLILDLDRFKAVNDSLGHQVGDSLLQLVAKRLTGALRDADVICRLSGDEFAIVMKRPSDPEAVGRRLVALLSRPYLIEGSTVTIGASIGIALAPDHGTDAPGLIRSADVAMYAAKTGGRRNARVFDADLDATSRQRQLLTEALRKAVSLRQFELHFQPQLVLDTGELSGFEAFLRWRHPELGSMAPQDFLPLAEDTGLIWPIAEWVLREACEAAITWPAHLSVSVNVSAKQLIDRHRLARLIRSVLLRTGLAPRRLEIEVPEKAVTQQPEVVTVLTAIAALGVRVSLDDFGTGYSSLSHLRQFPLHKLKIDHSFVHALGHSAEATNVVRAIAALGRSLGITTIAEGVETLDQRRQVEQDGCEAIQGYLLSRPVPAAEVGALIAAMPAFVCRPARLPSS